MNTEVLFSSKSEMWETPQDFFDKLDEEFHFDLDVCATPDNAKCKRYFTPEMDGLSRPWEGVCWCNPPYCRQTGKLARKARDEAGKGSCTVVMLLPCRPDVAWFHDYVLGKADLSMNVSEASRTLFMHRNTVIYHLGRIKKETGLDPQKFCALSELVNVVGWRPEPEGQNEQAKQPV